MTRNLKTRYFFLVIFRRFTGVVQAEEWPSLIGDYDKDGIPDLMVVFDRAAVENLLPDVFEAEQTRFWHHFEISLGRAGLTLGGLVNAASFEGRDTSN